MQQRPVLSIILTVAGAVMISLVIWQLGPRMRKLLSEPLAAGAGQAEMRSDTMKFKIKKSEEEWRLELPPDVYRITRQRGTEPAFTGKYYNFHGDGVYRCACCGNPLFDSKTKFESGSGWPSFFKPIADSDIVEWIDDSWLMTRTEIKCSKCGAHLGHVFDDGPKPTGLRYCVNSASLKFEDRKQADPSKKSE